MAGVLLHDQMNTDVAVTYLLCVCVVDRKHWLIGLVAASLTCTCCSQLQQLVPIFYWSGHMDDVRNWCKTCATSTAISMTGGL